MPKIYPIKCFRPSKSFASKFIRKPSDISGYDRDIDNLRKILRNTAFEIAQPDLFGQTFNDSRAIFNKLIRNSYIKTEFEKGYYLYKITSNSNTQIGLVCAQNINDIATNQLKLHEKTKSKNSEFIEQRLQQLKLMFTPIYSILPDETEQFKNDIYKIVEKLNPDIVIEADDDSLHEIYKVPSSGDLKKMIDYVQQAHAIYLADGHHRLLALQNVYPNQSINVPTILFSSADVHLHSFAKIIKEAELHHIAQFLSHFELHATHHNVKHLAEVYVGNDWHKLVPQNAQLSNQNNVQKLIGVNKLLQKSFQIENNEDDLNVLFFKDLYGHTSIQNYVNKIKADFSIRFIPLEVKDVFSVADNDISLPAKSTLFEPKPRAGLFITNL